MKEENMIDLFINIEELKRAYYTYINDKFDNECVGIISTQDLHFGKEGNTDIETHFKSAIKNLVSRAYMSHKLEKIVEKLVDDAMEGNIAAAREVMDRVEGKAIATQEVTGPDGTQLKTAVQLFFVEPDGTITAD